ncbi:MAG: hypothetical protein LBS92_07375 [Candidatus Methanoplasma sp.]|jgi:hypothetical protein|nr:hypothetical protein [Candidatus Methanoplasma sp.]
MGIDSSRNSGGFGKGLLKRTLGVNQSNNVVTGVKQRHPVFSVSDGDNFSPPGRTAKPAEVMAVQASKQINKDGFVVYNVNENDDVYITIESETAYFEEDEPAIMKMVSGQFFAGKKSARAETEVARVPEADFVEYSQASDLFKNAQRKKPREEVDFNEVIIKEASDDSYLVPEAHMFVGQSALTGTAVGVPHAETPVNFAEDSDYEILSDAPASKGFVTRLEPARKEAAACPDCNLERSIDGDCVPTVKKYAGLKQVSGKTIDLGRYNEIRDRVMKSSEARPAAQSLGMFNIPKEDRAVVSFSAAPAPGTATTEPENIRVQETKVDTCPAGFATPVYANPAPQSAQVDLGAASGSATIAGSSPVAVRNPVADMLMLTLPELRLADELDKESDCDARYPEDGLELYDDRFIFT